MKKISICIILLIHAVLANAQQDPQFNLYQFNPLLINPAYAGARDALAISASVRSQWTGFDGAPKTNALSVHSPVLNKKLGVGLTVLSDKMGPRSSTGVYGNFAYILKLDRKTRLSFAVGAGYNRYQFAFSKLTFNSGEVPANFSQDQTKGVLDLTGGFYLRGSGYFIGISASHLNGATVYDYSSAPLNTYRYNLGQHLSITAGKSFIINNDFIFAPTLLLKTTAGALTADINLNCLIYKQLWLGVFYRTGYGPGGLLQYQIPGLPLKVGYSYDSGLKDARRLGGSHEVMIGFELQTAKSKMINPRFL